MAAPRHAKTEARAERTLGWMRSAPPVQITLLDLVQTVGEITEDEAEIVATVLHMLRSGTVKLAGSFRGEPASRFVD